MTIKKFNHNEKVQDNCNEEFEYDNDESDNEQEVAENEKQSNT